MEEPRQQPVDPDSETRAPGSAFGNPEDELAPEERDRLVESVARSIVGRGLATPAVFLLEMHKPLTFFGSQLLLLGSPILGAFLGFKKTLRFSAFLENRDNVELLVQRIEELQAQKRAEAAK